MNCAEFQECLFEWLEGRLEAAEVERMQFHAAGCLRCRELEELAAGDAGLPAVEPPDDMVASIMAQTTGGACDRALLLVSERLDAGSADVTGSIEADPLLEMHLESCAECARLAGALERLNRELPAMAEMEPDPGFVGDVMAATVGAAVPVRAVAPLQEATPVPHLVSRPAFDWREWVQSLPLAAPVHAFFERLSQRPRLAFEGAFVGTLAFLLVIGLPSAGVAELPTRLVAEVRQERLEIQIAVADNFGRAAEAGRAAWSTSTDRLGARLGEYVNFRLDTASTRSRLADMFGRWRQASIEIATHLWDGEFGAAFARMWRLWTEPWRSDGNEEGSPGVRAEDQDGQSYQS